MFDNHQIRHFRMDEPMIILRGNSHPDLADRITRHLDMRLGDSKVYNTSETDRETIVEINDSVRGKECYIIQTGAKDVNDDIMELLMLCYACKTSSCKRVIGVIPYLPYNKHTKMKSRGNIPLKLVAQMLTKAGFDHIITLDLHSKESLGFFDCTIDNLRASPFLIQYIQENIPNYQNSVIIAKSPRTARRAQSFAERLRLGIAVIHGVAKEEEEDELDRPTSPLPALNRITTVGEFLPQLTLKETPTMHLVGDIENKIAIMVDDVLNDIQHIVDASIILQERGACKIYVLATHGIFPPDAAQLIEESPIDEVVVTNTVPNDEQKSQCLKIKTIDISILLAEAIRRIRNKESMAHLFRNVTVED